MIKIEKETYNKLHKLLGEIAWWANEKCEYPPDGAEIVSIGEQAETILKELEDECNQTP